MAHVHQDKVILGLSVLARYRADQHPPARDEQLLHAPRIGHVHAHLPSVYFNTRQETVDPLQKDALNQVVAQIQISPPRLGPIMLTTGFVSPQHRGNTDVLKISNK